MTHADIREGYLYLNVWTGAKTAGEKRPVYVYIHGGGNAEGSGAVPFYYGGASRRRASRLGILGFFTHPDLTAESDVHNSGNYAILDLIAALRWMHDNVAGVTIGCQSAGTPGIEAR